MKPLRLLSSFSHPTAPVIHFNKIVHQNVLWVYNVIYFDNLNKYLILSKRYRKVVNVE